jgi:hypothetical protein
MVGVVGVRVALPGRWVGATGDGLVVAWPWGRRRSRELVEERHVDLGQGARRCGHDGRVALNLGAKDGSRGRHRSLRSQRGGAKGYRMFRVGVDDRAASQLRGDHPGDERNARRSAHQQYLAELS